MRTVDMAASRWLSYDLSSSLRMLVLHREYEWQVFEVAKSNSEVLTALLTSCELNPIGDQI
jgi:hypothetical protein